MLEAIFEAIPWDMVVMKLGYATLAIVVSFAAMWVIVKFSQWLDRRAGTTFAEALSIMEQKPEALASYYGRRILGILILGAAVVIMLGSLFGCGPAQAGVLTSSKHDTEIRRAVSTWWPDYPFPAAWKAQLYQESRLDPAAVSPVGAAGLAQFMPGTWAMVARDLRLPPGVSPHHDLAIEVGAYYMAKLRRQWSAPRPAEDRHRLAQASYNAGLGHLLAAQRLCHGPPGYEDIVACLPQVTGRHSAETIGYVKAIAKWRRIIEAGG
ncbi:transglycosylase SLT domain-containing protein [Shumkonia mesophila]|uniref:transglycosylase SLT domain-containing protein n=1 Tax=Shumkonia mesophila TaxID=2838854 RepID=UPI00293487C7|nr:transglycosylase SLT domain-containing protein [Shumkonia mesophila]